MNQITLPTSSGLTGWKYLQSSMSAHKRAITHEAGTKRLQDHIHQNARSFKDADSFLSDFKAKTVVLGAFGLSEDIKNNGFIRKVLSSDLTDPKSFANRLSDKRYLEMATFLSQNWSNNGLSIEAENSIISKYIENTYSDRVGAANASFKIALHARSKILDISAGTSSEDTKIYKFLSDKSLHKFFQKLLGLPSSFSALPIDRQHSELKQKLHQKFGKEALDVIFNQKTIDPIIDQYVIRGSMSETSSLNKFSISSMLISSKRLYF